MLEPIDKEVRTSDTTYTSALVPVNKWPERHPWPPIGGLRHLIFHANTNGFNKVVRRAGRRVLIDEAAFFQWVDDQNSTRVGKCGGAS
jgi:hypothetical protein